LFYSEEAGLAEAVEGAEETAGALRMEDQMTAVAAALARHLKLFLFLPWSHP
jgi:hypothetical protein